MSLNGHERFVTSSWAAAFPEEPHPAAELVAWAADRIEAVARAYPAPSDPVPSRMYDHTFVVTIEHYGKHDQTQAEMASMLAEMLHNVAPGRWSIRTADGRTVELDPSRQTGVLVKIV